MFILNSRLFQREQASFWLHSHFVWFYTKMCNLLWGETCITPPHIPPHSSLLQNIYFPSRTVAPFPLFFLSLFPLGILTWTRPLRKAVSLSLSVLELTGKRANRLMTWEGIQKENLLTDQNKRQRGSDTERLKRTSSK